MLEDITLGNLYQKLPITIEKGLGSHVWDVDGNEFIDYGMGNGACFLGHSDPDVLDHLSSN